MVCGSVSHNHTAAPAQNVKNLANKEEGDQYLLRQDEIWKHWRAKADVIVSPVVQRLRSRTLKTETKTQFGSTAPCHQ